MIRRILALLRKPVEAPQTTSDAARTLGKARAAKAAAAKSARTWAHIAALRAAADYPPNRMVEF